MRNMSIFMAPIMCLLLLASGIANATTPCCHSMGGHVVSSSPPDEQAEKPCHEMEDQRAEMDCEQCDCMHCAQMNATVSSLNFKHFSPSALRIIDAALLQTRALERIFQPPKTHA